jgi:hypothetical protein
MADPGPGIGGFGELGGTLAWELFGRRAEEERVRDMLRQLRPSPGIESQTTQEPTGRYRVGPPMEPPEEPPSIAQGVFSGRTQGFPYAPDRAERAGLGPDLTARGDMAREATPRATMSPYPYAAASDQSGQEGATAQIPDALAAPTPAFPRREPIERRQVLGPETAPVTTTRTVMRPGKALLDVIAENPGMLTVLKAHPELAKLIQEEQDRAEWDAVASGSTSGGGAPAVGTGTAQRGTAEPTTDAGGAPVDPQVAALRRQRQAMEPMVTRIVGTRLASTPRGIQILGEYQKVVSAEDTAIKRASEEQKARREEAQYAGGQTYVRAKVAQLRSTGDPADASLADTLEAHGADPKLGAVLEKHNEFRQKEEENRLKRMDAERPIVIDKVPYSRTRDPITGELGLKATPGFERPAWWDGKTETELSAAANDPAQPPAIRAQARQTLADLTARKVEANLALVPKPTGATEKEYIEHANQLQALEAAQRLVTQHPDFIQGFDSIKWAKAYDAPDELKGTAAWIAQFPPGYAEFRSYLDSFTARRLNELAGSALTAGEVKRYAAFLPNVYQPPARFLANLAASREMLTATKVFHEERARGKSFEQAHELVVKAMDAAVARAGSGPTGPSAEPPAPPATADDVVNRFRIPQRSKGVAP